MVQPTDNPNYRGPVNLEETLEARCRFIWNPTIKDWELWEVISAAAFSCGHEFEPVDIETTAWDMWVTFSSDEIRKHLPTGPPNTIHTKTRVK